MQHDLQNPSRSAPLLIYLRGKAFHQLTCWQMLSGAYAQEISTGWNGIQEKDGANVSWKPWGLGAGGWAAVLNWPDFGERAGIALHEFPPGWG